MPDDAPYGGKPTAATSEALTAEAKRRAARRRFMSRGAAAGSGLVIVTLYHTRALGWTATTYREKLISSVEACNSLHGNLVKDYTGYPKKFDNSVTGYKDRYKCQYQQ